MGKEGSGAWRPKTTAV